MLEDVLAALAMVSELASILVVTADAPAADTAAVTVQRFQARPRAMDIPPPLRRRRADSMRADGT